MKIDTAKVVNSGITKVDLVKLLSEELLRVALGHDEYDAPIMVSKTTQSKNKIDVECTDGTRFELELKM